MGAGMLSRVDRSALPDEGKVLARAPLETGRFQSVDEAMVEALRLLQEREELFAAHRDELRAQIAEGVAAEERGELRNGHEAIADVRRRIDERLRSGE
jgi:Arc/MetJ-type ribon-helix-helix transcriptional regulator